MNGFLYHSLLPWYLLWAQKQQSPWNWIPDEPFFFSFEYMCVFLCVQACVWIHVCWEVHICAFAYGEVRGYASPLFSTLRLDTEFTWTRHSQIWIEWLAVGSKVTVYPAPSSSLATTDMYFCCTLYVAEVPCIQPQVLIPTCPTLYGWANPQSPCFFFLFEFMKYLVTVMQRWPMHKYPLMPSLPQLSVWRVAFPEFLCLGTLKPTTSAARMAKTLRLIGNWHIPGKKCLWRCIFIMFIMSHTKHREVDIKTRSPVFLSFIALERSPYSLSQGRMSLRYLWQDLLSHTKEKAIRQYSPRKWDQKLERMWNNFIHLLSTGGLPLKYGDALTH